MQRVETLDYLRGVMAVAIMLYHFGSWKIIAIPETVAPILNLLGLYGVGIFYVLSGAALSLIYFRRSREPRWIIPYAAKRFMRIAPLLWLATALTIYQGASQDPYKIFLNISLLFGFFAHDEYIATGAWSLGNEAVFYAVFPVVIALMHSRFGIAVAVLGSILISAYFAIFALDAEATVASQWAAYINPLNQIHLFVAGMAAGMFINRCRPIVPWISYTGAIGSATGICLIAYNFQGAALITDWVRFALSALCVGLCLSLGLINLKKGGSIAGILGFLGTTSYSIYLLHPIIVVQARSLDLPAMLGNWFVPVLILAVISLSYLSYNLIEKPGMILGRLLSWRHSKDQTKASTAP